MLVKISPFNKTLLAVLRFTLRLLVMVVPQSDWLERRLTTIVFVAALICVARLVALKFVANGNCAASTLLAASNCVAAALATEFVPALKSVKSTTSLDKLESGIVPLIFVAGHVVGQAGIPLLSASME